ncbi:hypothetical protein [Oceanobacillus bengalensis]
MYVLLVLFSISIIISGCNDVEKKTTSEQERDPVLIEESQFGLDPSGGTFYRYSEIKNIGTYEIGPLTANIETAEAVKGSFKDDYESYNVNANETIEMINFHIQFELNKDIEDVSFNQEHIHLKTNTGEKIDTPHELLSSVVSASILKSPKNNNESYLRQFSFPLQESTLQDIKKVTLIIDAPLDSKGEPLGEDLEVEVNF